MLDNLDQVDWERLEATEVPDLLRALASDDAETRSNALYELYGDICHQGTVCEATAYAVPFLLELIQERAIVARPDIIAFLRDLSTGTSREPNVAETAREAVVEGTGIYLRLLSDEESDIRIMAAFLLAALAEGGVEIGPRLLRQLETESHPQAKAALVFSLHELGSNSPEQASPPAKQIDLMISLMRSDLEPALVHLAAAFYLIRNDGGRVREEAESVLLQTFDPCSRDLFDLPWMESTNLLSKINDELWGDSGARLNQLLRSLENPNYETCSGALEEIEDVCGRQPDLASVAVPYYLKMIEHENVIVRTVAESSLPNLGAASALAVGRLRQLLSHPNEGVRKTARFTLKRLGREGITEPYSEPPTAAQLPRFKYHPDPLATGAVVRSDQSCLCCGKSRGFIYTLTFYAEADLDQYAEAEEDQRICPWCISDGSAASRFGAIFNEDSALAAAGIDPSIIEEVTQRTPGFVTWQGENWLVHCNDACAFLGDASKQDLKNLAAGKGEIVDIQGWDLTQLNELIEFSKYYKPGGSPAVYKFQCRHCNRALYYSDCD